MCLKDAFLTGGIAPPYAAWTCAEQQLDGVGIWDSESTECHMINGGFCIQYNEWLTRVRCRRLLRWWLLVEGFPSSYLHSGSFLPLNTNQKMEESLTSFTPLKAFLEYLSHLLNLCLYRYKDHETCDKHRQTPAIRTINHKLSPTVVMTFLKKPSIWGLRKLWWYGCCAIYPSPWWFLCCRSHWVNGWSPKASRRWRVSQYRRCRRMKLLISQKSTLRVY